MDPNLKMEIESIKNDFRLHQQQNTSAIERMTDALQAMQKELAVVGRRVEDVTRLQVNHEQQRDSIDRAFHAIRDLAESVDTGFKGVRSEHEEWRLRHERDESDWREKHVAENQKTRDKVIWFSGAAAMLSLLASACVGLVMYYTSQSDTYQQRERDRLEHTVQDNSARLRALETSR